ncbi:MAG: threonine synthase [Chloroflexi bacterium]|nr:threonine synthase [Ardenticatenaceae bacterium]MBL1130340.1 threonine synthase [Chloroflexota bacterium]NOG36431.1 threonine synthase [Chloroflexota bacterium]GIK57805.1 MAG: threonine synthase [Chloroflexota bacterium]
MSYLSHLECSLTGQRYDADQVIRLSDAGQPLLARYDLAKAAAELDRDALLQRPCNMWRFRELLPVRDPQYITTFGEGGKPILKLDQLGRQLGLNQLYLKDEGQNPTGSFKALGLAAAVSRARELGVTEFVIPTAGNAGGALAAYAARAGLRAHVYMPQDAPLININEVQMTGADLHLVNGLINDAGREAAADAIVGGWFDVSTLKEPYRVEGKKIMGYELAATFNWELPDVIIYPTGGGTGLIGMWKAFAEMEELGWIGRHRPRMVAAQADGCAPVVKAFHEGWEATQPWENAVTLAGGLRVPVTIGGRLMLQALRESKGTGVAVSDGRIFEAQQLLARSEGIFVSFEAAATIAALQDLVAQQWLHPDERILVFNTGSGLKYRLLLS